ncbi:MAG: DNA polymerase I, partial [Planctomycetes bacterium]|nr:DNA polymerase I [Planctomycetota bacterium]
MPKSLYLIDGHYQIYRSFYAAPQHLANAAGEPTGAVHVFLQMLMSVVKAHRPDYLAIMMDVSDKTVFRCDIDKNYKAHRDPAPAELHTQADRIIAIIEALGIPLHRLEGFEADDLMATATEQLKDKPIEVFLVSRDKDLEQLLNARVRMYDPTKNLVIDQDTLQTDKGYTPAQAVEIQTLTGDSTDNIPGVRGIGPKTAAKLINEYGSAQAVFDHADKLTPKMAENVRSFADQLPLTRQLVTLKRDVPFEFTLADCSTDRLNFEALRPIFKELDFGRLAERLRELTNAGADDKVEPATDADPAKGPPSFAEGEGWGKNTIRPPPLLRKDGAPAYHLIDTTEKLRAFVAELGKQSTFAFDTETTGLNPVAADLVGLSFCWKAGEAYYLPVRASVGEVLSVETVVEQLKPIFENATIGKVGQNIKYDVLVMRQVGIDVAGLAFDTMIASFLLEPLGRSHSMNALARYHFDHEMIPITDLIGKGKDQITMDQIDTVRTCEYAAEDADFTWRLYEMLAPKIAGSDLESLFVETEMPLVSVLAEMEHNGIALDTKLLAELGESMEKRMVELSAEVHAAAGHSFNIASTKQLAEVLFDEQGLEVVRKTKTGRSTDADTLQTLASLGDNPVPGLILSLRELTKLKNTYIDTLPKMVCKRTGRVHASFDQTGAVTGRLSSRDPNLQNIPVRTETGRKIRRAFLAGDPGSVLLAADYSQVELRLLAHFCKDEALLAAFRSGQDIHRAVAAEVNGVSLEDVSAEQRSAAKAVNFGIIYGQTAFGLSRALGVPVGEAKAFIDAYFDRYPGIRAFIDQSVDRARQLGYAQTILGRRRPIPELQSRNRQQNALGQRLAINTVVQGSAADLIKRAMIAIHAAFEAGKLHAKMLIQVHDELVFEVPQDRVESDAALIRTEMETALELDVPVVVDLAWGQTWADAK